jgi:hypothetical protein
LFDSGILLIIDLNKKKGKREGVNLFYSVHHHQLLIVNHGLIQGQVGGVMMPTNLKQLLMVRAFVF